MARLLLIGVGGGRVGDSDPPRTLGMPAKLSACVAERVDASPWPSLAQRHGFRDADTAVFTFAITGMWQISEPTTVVDDVVHQLLHGMISPGQCSQPRLPQSGEQLLVVSPPIAQLLAVRFPTVADLQQALFETVRIPMSWVPSYEREATRARLAELGIAWRDDLMPIRPRVPAGLRRRGLRWRRRCAVDGHVDAHAQSLDGRQGFCVSTLRLVVPELYDFWRSTRGVGPVATPRGAHGVVVGHHHARRRGHPPTRAHVDRRRHSARVGPRCGVVDGPGARRARTARRSRGVHPRTWVGPRWPRAAPRVRTCRAPNSVHEALVVAILGQKVQSDATRRSAYQLAARFGQAAPGPCALRLLPTTSVLASLDYSALHPCNVERARADRIVGGRGAAHGWRRGRPPTSSSLPGVGPWTAAVTALAAWGDPDAVPVGDFHLPNTVCWALARERGDDARMLELLEPYRGHRGLVVQLLTNAQISAPKRGPRLAVSDFRRR